MPEAADTDRPNRLPWPPILYAAVLLGAYGLERFWPLPAPSELILVRALGGLAFCLGFAIALSGVLRFRKAGTPLDPTGIASTLVQDGIYRYTRNPMYLGVVVAYAGLGVLLGSWWLILLNILMLFLLYALAIKGEEAFLERLFGDAYLDYKRRVGRWFGRI